MDWCEANLLDDVWTLKFLSNTLNFLTDWSFVIKLQQKHNAMKYGLSSINLKLMQITYTFKPNLKFHFLLTFITESK